MYKNWPRKDVPGILPGYPGPLGVFQKFVEGTFLMPWDGAPHVLKPGGKQCGKELPRQLSSRLLGTKDIREEAEFVAKTYEAISLGFQPLGHEL